MVVEGQTEETFVKSLITPHLSQSNVFSDARCVETSRDRKIKKIYRGGLFSYEKAKKDVVLWMKEDKHDDCFFTTMFDLYALPNDWPKYEEAKLATDPYQRVSILEQAFKDDLQHPRFIPYIQLHEWEALILADPEKFALEFFDQDPAIQNIINLCTKFNSPEMINDDPETAPSKRIIKKIPEYEDRKSSAGPHIAREIGLPRILEKCRHFKEWVLKLESLDRSRSLT
jgi:hypothetical protein